MRKIIIISGFLLISIFLSSCTTKVLFGQVPKSYDEIHKKGTTHNQKCLRAYKEGKKLKQIEGVYWVFGYYDENGAKKEIKTAGSLGSTMDELVSGEYYWFNINYYGEPIWLFLDKENKLVKCRK